MKYILHNQGKHDNILCINIYEPDFKVISQMGIDNATFQLVCIQLYVK